MRLPPLLFAAALVGLAGSAQAASTSYTIDPTHTFPMFELSHLGFSTFRGRFNDSSGTVTLDPQNKTGSVEVTIRVASVDSGVAKLDEHLLKPDFFDAAKFPTITFKASDFRFEGEKPVAVTGELNMHGVSKPVTLAVEAFTCKPHPLAGVWACGADLSTTIKRSDWGISTYVPAVGDDVRLRIEVEAHPKKDGGGRP
jgi:polyisoprenoid-binding protein YceI